MPAEMCPIFTLVAGLFSKAKEQTFKDVLAKYGTKSKGRDLMDEVVEINKRRRLY